MTKLGVEASPAPLSQRLIGRNGQGITITRQNKRLPFYEDFYAFLMRLSWFQFIALITVFYFFLNVLFALLYFWSGNSIHNAAPDSFADAFFFSVQTLATIGYGHFAPKGLSAHIIASLEAFVGMLGLALSTGVIFTKFSKPTSKVLFSNFALIQKRDGKDYLVFRVANERGNQIVEATMECMLAIMETTAEGERLRRFYDLKLLRKKNPIFVLSWLVMHPIDEESPFFSQSLESLKERLAELIVTMSGLDETLHQVIHARHSFIMDEVIPNARFEDIIVTLADGTRSINYAAFHSYRSHA